MHTHEEIIGDVVVVRLKGELLDDTDDSVVNQKVTSLLTDGVRKVIFDLGQVRRINSRGLSSLISAVNSMQSGGGEVRFAEIGRNINSLFVETRLVRIFKTYETVGRALASFYQEQVPPVPGAFPQPSL